QVTTQPPLPSAPTRSQEAPSAPPPPGRREPPAFPTPTPTDQAMAVEAMAEKNTGAGAGAAGGVAPESGDRRSRFRRICVYCGSAKGRKASYQDAAVELGKELGGEGHRPGLRRRLHWAHGPRLPRSP
uniref:Uncharacterized protein n=1 Tax=Aegilops tauschii subsp. strangulata TaxID=200361 RepID=A0A453EZG5_AEGTS